MKKHYHGSTAQLLLALVLPASFAVAGSDQYEAPDIS